ncbi:MAG: helix-turn-helix transcriptional regulator [Myxococcales bacterium]
MPTRIAAQLGVGARGLRRHLRDEGSSVRALLDEHRMRAARAILAMPNTTVKETAERLGYSEPSAFHRAFKRWTGSTPHDFLIAQRGHGAPRPLEPGRPSPLL